MGAEAHVNTCYKHFYYFVTELNLIDRKELEPLVSVNTHLGREGQMVFFPLILTDYFLQKMCQFYFHYKQKKKGGGVRRLKDLRENVHWRAAVAAENGGGGAGKGRFSRGQGTGNLGGATATLPCHPRCGLDMGNHSTATTIAVLYVKLEITLTVLFSWVCRKCPPSV